MSKAKRRGQKGAFGTLTTKAGTEYNFDKNTIDGLPPLVIGDEFYFRGKGSESAVVNRVRIIDISGRIGVFDVLNLPGMEPEVLNSLQVDLRRIEVVQMIEKPQPKAEAKPDAPELPATAPDPSTYTEEQKAAIERQRNVTEDVGNAAGPAGTADALTAEKLAEAKKTLDTNPVPSDGRHELNAEARANDVKDETARFIDERDNLTKVDEELTEEARAEATAQEAKNEQTQD